MKKFIALALSIMMVMSLITVPVMAEDAAVEYPAPLVHIKAANVMDSHKYDAASGKYSFGGTILEPINLNGEPTSPNGSFNTRFHNLADKTGWPVEVRIGNVRINPEEYEGFKLDAAQEFNDYNMDTNTTNYYNGSGIKIYHPAKQGWFVGKDLRVDSVRFKMPEFPEEDEVEGSTPSTFLFGMVDVDSTGKTADPLYGGNSLRIRRGGAWTVDLSKGSNERYAFIPEGTFEPEVWYRAERILDTRIDAGATGTGTENWQRFKVYNDATGALIGDSGWVMSGNYTGDATKPIAFAAFNYPADSYWYIEDIKTWVMDNPSTDYVIGEEAANPKYLSFPVNAGAATTLRNLGLSYSTTDDYYYGSASCTVDFDGDGVAEPYGKNGDHRAEVAEFVNAVKANDYIYFQQDFMIPEVNTTNFGLMDLEGIPAFWAQGTQGFTHRSPIRIVNGVLTVNSWDYNAPGNFTTPVKDDKGEAFSITLTPGEWYTALLVIDREGMDISNTGSGGVPTKAVTAADGTVTHTPYVDADTTKAHVEITDSEGNKHVTEEFTYKSLNRMVNWGKIGAIIMADAQMPTNVNTAAPAGFKVNLDNQKLVFSDGAMDAEDAFVLFTEDFQSKKTGATLQSFETDNFNPRVNSAIANGGVNSSAAVVAEREKTTGIPKEIKITFENAINGDAETLARAVKLYQGANTADSLISGTSYDSETNTLTVSFSALEPEETYTVTVDRAVAADDSIFSVLAGSNGKVASYSFVTGFSDSQPFKFIPAFGAGGDMLEDGVEFDADLEVYSEESILKSYNEADAPYVVIAALYDADGRMEDIIAQTGVIPAQSEITIDFEGEYLIATENTVSLRAFVWNTWSLMKPMTAIPYVYSAQ